jgi:heme exporter protein B
MTNRRYRLRQGEYPLAEILTLLKKEFRTEFRSGYAVITGFVFAVSAVILVSMTVGGIVAGEKTLSALYWIIILFSAMQFLSRVFVREEEEGTGLFLRLRYSSDAVFVSKFCFNCVMSLVLTFVVSLLFIFLFNVRTVSIPYGLAVSLTGVCALAAALSFGGVLSSRGEGKSALFAVIAIPSALPVMLSSIRGMTSVFSGLNEIGDTVIFNAAFTVSVFAVSLLLFKHIWHEDS